MKLVIFGFVLKFLFLVDGQTLNQTFIELPGGNYMPVLGLGTWLSKDNDVYQAVKDALEAGYRHIDTALIYGNEREIGRAINDTIKAGKIRREDIFVVTKVWNTFHSKAAATKCIDMSLKNLGLSYVDLVLIHWPFGYKEGHDLRPVDPKTNKTLFSDVDYLETWRALEDAHRAKKVRSIGVSNFNSKQLDRVIKNSAIKPVVNQVECHPYLTNTKLIEFCKNNSVVVTAYSPLGHGNLLKEPALKNISIKYRKSPAQILIRYQIDRLITVIPKTTNKTRIIENFNVWNFRLTNNDMKAIDSLNRNDRFSKHEQAKDHKYYPFKEPY